MIPPKNLDDLTYQGLVDQALAAIPGLCPAWTDHNPSDPGIALVELLAWLTEMVAFRINRVSDESYWAFLYLLDGQGWPPPAGGDLRSSIRTRIGEQRQVYRAIVPADFVTLLSTAWTASDHAALARVRCLPEYDATLSRSAPGHVSIVVYSPTAEILADVRTFLAPRCLLTTKLHVVAPRVVAVAVSATLYLKRDARTSAVVESAHPALATELDPLLGGPAGSGWPFGRDLHPGDVYSILERVAGVEFVTDVVITVARQPMTVVVMGEYDQIVLAALTLHTYEPIPSATGSQWLMTR